MADAPTETQETVQKDTSSITPEVRAKLDQARDELGGETTDFADIAQAQLSEAIETGDRSKVVEQLQAIRENVEFGQLSDSTRNNLSALQSDIETTIETAVRVPNEMIDAGMKRLPAAMEPIVKAAGLAAILGGIFYGGRYVLGGIKKTGSVIGSFLKGLGVAVLTVGAMGLGYVGVRRFMNNKEKPAEEEAETAPADVVEERKAAA